MGTSNTIAAARQGRIELDSKNSTAILKLCESTPTHSAESNPTAGRVSSQVFKLADSEEQPGGDPAVAGAGRMAVC